MYKKPQPGKLTPKSKKRISTQDEQRKVEKKEGQQLTVRNNPLKQQQQLLKKQTKCRLNVLTKSLF